MGQQAGCLFRDEGDERKPTFGGRCTPRPEAACCLGARHERRPVSRSPSIMRTANSTGMDECVSGVTAGPSMTFAPRITTASEVQAIQSQVETMQAALTSIKRENERLARLNSGLEQANMRLRNSISEHHTRRAWRSFDVVEHHYKQLEKFRRRRMSGLSSCSTPTGDADMETSSVMQPEDSCASSPSAVSEDIPLFCPEGVQSRSMATPRTAQTSVYATPQHSHRDHHHERCLSPVPQSPDVHDKSDLGSPPAPPRDDLPRLRMVDLLSQPAGADLCAMLASESVITEHADATEIVKVLE